MINRLIDTIKNEETNKDKINGLIDSLITSDTPSLILWQYAYIAKLRHYFPRIVLQWRATAEHTHLDVTQLMIINAMINN